MPALKYTRNHSKHHRLQDEFEELATNASEIDFSKSKTPDTVRFEYILASTFNPSSDSVFETTIRYLAGLLSAYQMSNKSALLEKAVQVADKLAFAWVGVRSSCGFYVLPV